MFLGNHISLLLDGVGINDVTTRSARARSGGPRLLRRGLPLSLLGHGLLFALVLALAVAPSRRSEPAGRGFRAAFEGRRAIEMGEEIVEPAPRPSVPQPADEPRLVESRFEPTIEFPPDPPEPEPLDWLAPADPLGDLPPFKGMLASAPESEGVPEPPSEPPPEGQPQPRPAPSGRLEPPAVLVSPSPRYPRQAVRLGWQGSVRLRISVDAGGAVSELRLLQSSGHGVLDQAAMEAFRRWVFEPRKPGEPELRSFEKRFTFRLH